MAPSETSTCTWAMVLTWLTSNEFKVTHWGWGALHILLPLWYVNTFGYVTPHSWVSELWAVGFCWIYSVDSWGSEGVQDFTVLFWVWFQPLSKCFGVVLMLFKKKWFISPLCNSSDEHHCSSKEGKVEAKESEVCRTIAWGNINRSGNWRRAKVHF